MNGGWPAPEPEETFSHYWARVGANDDVLDWALSVRPGAEDCANDRMATWLRLYRPGLFLEEIDRLAAKHGIPVHWVGVSEQYPRGQLRPAAKAQ